MMLVYCIFFVALMLRSSQSIRSDYNIKNGSKIDKWRGFSTLSFANDFNREDFNFYESYSFPYNKWLLIIQYIDHYRILYIVHPLLNY